VSWCPPSPAAGESSPTNFLNAPTASSNSPRDVSVSRYVLSIPEDGPVVSFADKVIGRGVTALFEGADGQDDPFQVTKHLWSARPGTVDEFQPTVGIGHLSAHVFVELDGLRVVTMKREVVPAAVTAHPM